LTGSAISSSSSSFRVLFKIALPELLLGLGMSLFLIGIGSNTILISFYNTIDISFIIIEIILNTVIYNLIALFFRFFIIILV